MIVDLVIWTKNGSRTLPKVLDRINEVIPAASVNSRIIVDDASTDGTKEIAIRCGWQVIQNEGAGISDGANTALKNVSTEYFVSFEQDVLLAEDWWEKVPVLLDGKTIVASGLRLPDSPKSLRDIEEYIIERDKDRGFLIGKALDNTIYNTKALRQIGGFPSVKCSAGVDVVLLQRVRSAGFYWKINYNVKSIHMRNGLLNELKHDYWYGQSRRHLLKESRENASFSRILSRTLYSPIQGIRIAIAKRNWEIVFVFLGKSIAYCLGVIRSIFT